MSTYNGSEKIIRQVDTILNQSDIDTNILIRDDGSDQNTINILKKIKNSNPNRIEIIYDANIGWKKSFVELLYLAPFEYDYYGFSDQDDIWMEDKLSSCIKMMEEDCFPGIKLAHCNGLSVDENLIARKEQEKRIPIPPNYKAALATEYFQGCGMVWNRNAMSLIQKYHLQNDDISHDYWVGLLCYFFGKVYFCEEIKFFHIRYGSNQSTDGNQIKGRLTRIKSAFCSKTVYMNPSVDLLEGYGKDFDESQKQFLLRIKGYKKNFTKKILLIFDPEFRRPSLFATIFFKLQILLSKY